MNESAFRNIWARVMFFKFSKLHEPQAVQFKNLENITRDHISRNARAIIRFFIYNILNKIIKRKEENATVTLLWTRNSVIVHRFCFSRNFNNCDEKNKPKIGLSFTTKQRFYSNWKLSKLRKNAIQKSHIAFYNVSIFVIRWLPINYRYQWIKIIAGMYHTIFVLVSFPRRRELLNTFAKSEFWGNENVG